METEKIGWTEDTCLENEELCTRRPIFTLLRKLNARGMHIRVSSLSVTPPTTRLLRIQEVIAKNHSQIFTKPDKQQSIAEKVTVSIPRHQQVRQRDVQQRHWQGQDESQCTGQYVCGRFGIVAAAARSKLEIIRSSSKWWSLHNGHSSSHFCGFCFF